MSDRRQPRRRRPGQPRYRPHSDGGDAQHRGEGCNREEECPPSHQRLDERTNRSAGRGPSGYRPEQPAQRPATFLKRYHITDERQADRYHAARPDSGDDPPRDESLHARHRCGSRGQEHEEGERSEDDRAPPEAIRQRTPRQRRYPVRHEVGGHRQPHPADVGVKDIGQARDERRNHECLGDDEKGCRAEDRQHPSGRARRRRRVRGHAREE